MASNSSGSFFRYTTWGESHGKALGVVIDGCPAGVPLTDEMINEELAKRAPGQNPYTSPRNEKDTGTILSGIFEGVTTGAPICFMIQNKDADSTKYAPIADLMRPGHANFTYLSKYGEFDYRGGGRSSARETAARVAAGAVAKAFLQHTGITIFAFLSSVGTVKPELSQVSLESIHNYVRTSPIFAPDAVTEKQYGEEILAAKEDKDSVGGIITFCMQGVPVGLGDPVYEKFEAKLAAAFMSMPATKGFEIGEGFAAASLRGSQHNDSFRTENGKIICNTNHAGGTLGGITTGETIIGRVAFKPTSSIERHQKTVDRQGKEADFMLPEGSRHDPCVAVRAVPVVEAMCWLVVADTWLMNRALHDAYHETRK